MVTDPLEPIIQDLLALRKYRGIELPEETVRDLLVKELPFHRNTKEAVKEVRKKLHNIVAAYLGDPDYSQATQELETTFASGDVQSIKATCTRILSIHASTRERLRILDTFYPRIFALTGKPQTILDLACGLNPLTYLWMGLVPTTSYYAYDLHQPRIAFINNYFRLQGLSPLAEACDILVNPPKVEGDVAFIFKEAHRFEQRQHGCNRALWLALKVRYLIVSLPPQSLSGQHHLEDKQRRLVYSTLEGLNWKVVELMFENEMVFVIEKC